MAIAWIHSGAMQFFGHVGLQTRSCYAWGVAEYFLALLGRFTFAEAVWLNQQSRVALEGATIRTRVAGGDEARYDGATRSISVEIHGFGNSQCDDYQFVAA